MKVVNMKSAETKDSSRTLTIPAPRLVTNTFKIEGTAPLVVHRFSHKVSQEFIDKIVNGSTPGGKKKHEPQSLDQLCEDAKYYGQTGKEKWEGFNASAIRCAMISACRLVNFKMTLAKLSVFVEEDGRDITNPLYSLIRIHGESKRTEMVARTETGVAMMTIRPMYYPWSANIKIRFDTDQFKRADVANLLMRVGAQVGVCEGRPDSKNSAGMGWGLFRVCGEE